jgi:ribosomal protein S19
MSRSKWKISFFEQSLLKSNTKKVRARSSVIPSCLINKSIFIYTGLDFKKIYVSREKVGFKAGEFALTRGRKSKKIKK